MPKLRSLTLGEKFDLNDGGWERIVLVNGKLLKVGVTPFQISERVTGWIYHEEDDPNEVEPLFEATMPKFTTAQNILREAGIEYLPV